MRWSRRSTRPTRIRASRRRPMAWSRRQVRCASRRASHPAARPITRARHSNASPNRPTRSIIRCHSTLPLEQAEVAARRQIIDVPATVFDVIEHRTLAVTCRCGQAHVSSFPDEVPNWRNTAQRARLGRAFDARPNAAVCSRYRTDPRCVWPDNLAGHAAGVVAEARAACKRRRTTLPTGCMPRRS